MIVERDGIRSTTGGCPAARAIITGARPMQKPFKESLEQLLAQYTNYDLEEIVNALDDAHDRLEDKLLAEIGARNHDD